MDQVFEFLKGFNFQTILSLAAIIWFFFGSIKSEIVRLEAKMDSQRERMDRQGERTDRLYEMFVELRKENELNRKEVDQKFYELLKEGKK